MLNKLEFELYIKNAIKLGFKTLVFSDHEFFSLVYNKHQHDDYKELDNYLINMLNLSKKYKNKIDIKLAFESEYDVKSYNFYRFLLEEKGFNYLILGEHLKTNKGHNVNKNLENIINALETGLFKHICHPDSFLDHKNNIDIITKLCNKSKELNIPLEINYEEIHTYNDFFWNYVKDSKTPIILGIDSHNSDDLNDELMNNISKTFDLDLFNINKDILVINLNCKH